MRKILIVDDTKGIQTLLSKCLRMEGFETQVCGDGKTAVEILMCKKFDLIFLDIRLPVLGGTEVLKKTRESNITTPVVVITAHANIHNAIECTRLGAVLYIQKPFTVNRILGILDDLGIRGDSHSNGLIKEAQKLFEQHRYEDVEKFLKNMVPNDMLNPELYRMLAEVSSKQDKIQESQQYYKIYNSLINGQH